MAPKKVEEPERKPLIGRVGTNLKVGIVGIPNVGKSTFFNVLTKSQAAAENFPFCTIDPNENKGFVEFFIAKVMCDAYRDYVKENDKKYAKKIFDLNASYIGKIDYLHHIKEHPRSEYVLPWPPPHDAPYTKAHMYYVYNEDTNPFTRVGATCKCVEYEYKPHFEPPKEPFVVRDPYSETEARTKKLDSEPTTFVIFGKPGLNISKLATAIANASKCVLISPEALLKQEIDNKTDAGRYIARILRTGRAVGPEVIWKLIEIRISKRDVMHKGYVVEGLPLIPNDLNLDYSSYLDYEKDNEENDEISQRWSSSACDLLLTPESSDYRIAEKSMCKTENSYEEDTLRQIDDVFLTWPVKPSVIVYTICPDQDAISKRSLLRFDPRTGETIDTGLLRIGESMRASPNDADLPFGFYQEIMKEEGIFEEDQRRHLLTRIFDMRKNVEVQCLFYERSVMPVIEKWVLRHNPQNVVRVDARTSTSQMWEIVSERLRTLPLSLPSHAQRLIDPVEIEFQGEATTVVVANEKYEELSPEEVFLEMTNVGSVSPRFPWRLSRWKYLCPVELIKGRSVVGLAKHAVRFTDKIYFLSSSEAVELFLENPRTFLLPPNPRPTCKIAIFGPKYCGKSYLSRELARDFSGTVIDVHEAEEAFKQDRIEAMVANAMRDNTKDVISELKNRLVDEREARETSRLADLEAWLNDMFVTIGRLADLRSKVNDKTTVIAKSDEDESKILLEKLRDNGLASVETDKNLLKKIRANKYILRTYAPNYLREEEPRVPTPNEHDPLVLAMLDDRVRYLYDEPIDLGIDEKLRILVERIKTIPDESLKGGIQRDGGFVLDGMYVDADLWTKLAEETDIDFEDLILITEEEPFERLVERWLDFVGKDEESESDEYNNVNDRLSHDERENEEDESGLEAYIRHLANFRNNWNDFVFDVANVENDLIVCDVGVVDDVVGHAKKRMKERYDFEATIMSEEDREKEKLAIEEGLVLENLRQGRNVFDQRDVVQEEEEEEEEEEEGEKEEEGKENVANQIRDARWLGDTNDYCPVALSRHNVLWKGKEEFSATFMGKVYLFSSAVALEEFVQEPRKFGVPFLKPPATIPPLRISVIGPLGSGRTALSSALSKEYGLTHIDYTERFAEYMKERAMPPLTPKHTLIFPEDRLEEVVLPEDLTDEKYNSDQATVYTFVQHYSKNGGVLPTKMLQEWLLDFFRSPYDEHGLILNGFPSCSQDVDVALKSYTVPEVVIELRCSVNTCVERLLPVMLDLWKKRQDVRKSAEEERYNQELELYVLTRDKWINRIFEKRRAQEQAALLEEEEGFGDYGNLELEKKASSSRTMPTYDFMEETDAFEHVDVDDLMIGLDREELEEIWRREHPEPTEFTDWEDIDVARERMEREIEEAYDDDARKLEVIRESMEEETISWLEIDAESEEISVLLRVQSLLDPYVFRDISIFERVHPVSIDTAEQLLDRGYHYLSSFGRWCPVRISENKIPVQMFLPNEADRTLRAVLHRQYVYFLSGEKALKSFSRNPLKYLEQDSCLPLIPLRIAVIGPPKCGKTTLAERFAATYGMRLITRGTALRHALKNFEWTELAKLTKARLRSGHATLNESVARAVEMYSVHPHSATQGYVLDGFPTNRAEYEDLAFLGIQPMIVVDLKADLEFCLECLSYDVHNADEDDDDNDKKGKSKERRIPFNFSAEYLTHRYVKWRSNQGDFRKWLKKYAQNIVDIDATGSKWGVWTLSDREVRVRYADIRKYFREADYEKAHGLENMCVSPFEFKSRQSIYENYCPVCLLRDNAMISAELPLDRRGLVQLKDKFYWICQRHAKHFNDEPAIYVPPANTAVLPKERPRALQEVADPLHACWIRRIQFDGFCLVTYVENLPNRNLRLGRRDIGAIVEDKVYLFCSVECRQKFLSRYHDYSHVRIHFPYAMPPINVKELPNIGFLEQTVAKVLVEAVNQVAFLRPKIPGLSVSATAAVYIGVYLKIHDRSFDSKETSIYETVGKRMEARRQIIDTALRTMKRRLNPRVYFSKEYRRSIYDLEEKTSQQMSNYIRFRRTSPRQTLIDPNFPELFE